MVKDKLTVGKLIEMLELEDENMPVAFANWSDGELHFIEYAEVRSFDMENNEIIKRDMQDDWKENKLDYAFVLSVLG
jgi:hypothetical protein